MAKRKEGSVRFHPEQSVFTMTSPFGSSALASFDLTGPWKYTSYTTHVGAVREVAQRVGWSIQRHLCGGREVR